LLKSEYVTAKPMKPPATKPTSKREITITAEKRLCLCCGGGREGEAGVSIKILKLNQIYPFCFLG